MSNLLKPTESLCPVCLAKITAHIRIHDGDVILEKRCSSHGSFDTPIWRGPPAFEAWKRPKRPHQPPVTFAQIARGCPFDCGLCPEHRQRSCTILIEVTHRCDLKCPVCYADAGRNPAQDLCLKTIDALFGAAWKAGPNANIQISGGEPTVRDDLPEIVALGRKAGFEFVQLNTNGLRISRDASYLRALKKAGLASVFLQFDGLDDAIYQKIRGRPLLNAKMEAIRACGANGIGVVLTPTLVPGINTADIGAIILKAAELSPVVRAVHFQPISYFGRYFQTRSEKPRFTLPEIMRAIENQTHGMLKATHFKPPGCENEICSFHANFWVTPQGRIMPLQKSDNADCCTQPIDAEQAANRAIAYVARQWAAPSVKRSAAKIDLKTDFFPQQGCCDKQKSIPMALDDFIARANTHRLSISAMAFQDVWNVDLNRVRDCCIHVMSPDAKLIPFCLYNLTSMHGRRLYRQ